MTNKKILTLISLLLFLFLLVGCIPNRPPEITSAPVTKAIVGEDYTYNVVATDPDAGDVLTYSLITEPDGMLIDADSGVITWTPDTAGDFDVTVKVEDEGGLSDTQSFTITVIAVVVELDHIVVLPEAMNLFVRGSETITSVTAHYDDGSTANITLGDCTYLSSDEVVATVVAGVISALTPGTATITVGYGGETDTLEVTVNSILLTSIVVLPETMTLFAGDEPEAIESVTAYYSDGSETVLDLAACGYESSDGEVATVSDAGVVKAVAYGEATITVSYTEEEITKTISVEETDTVEVKVIGKVHNINANRYYDEIQEAIEDAFAGDTIEVSAGTYAPFTVDGKTNLTIQSSSTVTIEGAQVVTIAYPDDDGLFERDAVIFVNDSENIVLDGLDIQGSGLGLGNPKNYGIIYENSSGEINDCTVSPNTVGDMKSIAIGIWDNSDVTVNSCIIHNFGRLGFLIYDGCIASVLDSTIEGQVYSGEGEVCYGIEIEGVMNDATSVTASQVTITGNEIYNCDNTFAGGPTDQSGGIYINGWLGYYPEADCTVIVENNDIHDNYSGIIVIKSLLSYAHFNDIYDNRAFGVENLPAHDASTALFDATNNWWGDATGPYHPTANSGGLGDAVSDNVDFSSWE